MLAPFRAKLNNGCLTSFSGIATLVFAAYFLIHVCSAEEYINVWAVQINGGAEKAKQIAERNGFTLIDEILEDHYTFHHHQVNKRSTSASYLHHSQLTSDPEILWTEQQIVKRRVKRDNPADPLLFNDAYWKRQWYLYRQTNDRRRLLDMNVMPVWKQGYTGKGIVVTILDDGIERNHPDLVANYDPEASRDINGHDDDPMPRYDYTNENRHGTRCAGEVAASSNNSYCGVGVAYEAGIGGIRMLDGDVTDSVEAQSLSHNQNHIDIYSASWGPDDDGRTVDGPGPLARRAFRQGVGLGRGGKGSIFVWASGNGGRDGDSCNCDGYTNSIYTLSISSATENGAVPWYSEACSSTLSSTYSSGETHERQIATTDLRKSCTDAHTGTSASAPLAAGIVALVLQANPALTWRDMQYLVVMSSNPNNLIADDWVVNGVGRRVSHHFGYGIMNAAKMVDLAKNWTAVPPQRVCEIHSSVQNRVIPPQSKVRISLSTNGCAGSRDEVMYLEHVQARISLTSYWRGDIVIYLTSPMGTKSTLLSARVNDNNNKGFNEWDFMTTHNWGEFAEGTWLLEIENGYRASEPAHLLNWNLVLYGTGVDPLDPTYKHSKETIRKIQTRDHEPDEDGSSLSASWREEMAAAGIILPDIDLMRTNAKPKIYKPPIYKPPIYKPPVYKPADKPDFEYIQDNEIRKSKISGSEAQDTPDSGRSPNSKRVFQHGDHNHTLSFSDLLKDVALPSNKKKKPEDPHSRRPTLPSAATLQEWSLFLYGTDRPPHNMSAGGMFPGLAGGCMDAKVLYRDECVNACPHGWYSRRGTCRPCHVSCASCTSSINTSCIECYHGSSLKQGICLPLGVGIRINAGSSIQEGSPGLAPNTLWWLMVGATVAVCMLVVFLVLLAMYYAHTQNYLCTPVSTIICCKTVQTENESSGGDSTSNSSEGATPEHVKLTSQNSSQQELVSSEEEDDFEAVHRLRRHFHRVIV